MLSVSKQFYACTDAVSFQTDSISKWKPVRKEFRESCSPKEAKIADTEAESALYYQISLPYSFSWQNGSDITFKVN